MENPNSLEDRMGTLEDRLGRIEQAILLQQKKVAETPHPTQTQQQEAFQAKAVSKHEDDWEEEDEREERKVVTPPKPNPLIEWLKEDWLMKLGALLIILAMGWFVTYAVVNGWIGPTGQIAIGILVGAALLVAGHIVIPKQSSPGQVLVVTGGVAILLTLFAARTYYDFFTPFSVLLMMALDVVVMSVIAIMRNAKGVAITALLGGAIVPFLIDAPSAKDFTIITYIYLLNLGVLTVTLFRPWAFMVPIALVISAFYTLFAGLSASEYLYLYSYVILFDLGILIVAILGNWKYLIPMAVAFTGICSFGFDRLSDPIVWSFMGAFFGLFFIANLISIVKTQKANAFDLIASAFNGLLLLAWVALFVPKEWASIVLSGAIVLFLGITVLAAKLVDTKEPLFVNGALAVLFLGVATAFQLSGAELTLAYSIEAFLLVSLAVFLLKNARAAHLLSLVQVLPILLSLSSYTRYDMGSVAMFGEHFFVIIVSLASLAGTALLLRKADDKELFPVPIVHTVVASIGALAFIWLFMHKALDSVNAARGVSLFIYTLTGITLFFYGSGNDKKWIRNAGGILLGGTILRLFLVEVWSMAAWGRIGTFVAIGILLMSTAFYQKRKK